MIEDPSNAIDVGGSRSNVTQPSTFQRLDPVLRDAATLSDDEEITLDSELIRDLGFELIDLIDLVFKTENEFGFRISPTSGAETVSQKWLTVRDVVTYIDHRLAGGTG